MSDKDYIKELFSEKLGSYEAKVNPELWNGIASQIGTAGTTVATGMSVVTKWLIGVGIASVVTVTAIVVLNSGDETVVDTKKDQQVVSEVSEEFANDENTSVESEVEDHLEAETIVNDNENNTPVDPAQQNEPSLPVQDSVDPDQNTSGSANNTASDADNSTNNGTTTEENNSTDNNTMADNQPAVHTPDPVVEDPTLPKEIEAELPVSNNKDFSIGVLPNVFTPNGDGENDYFRIESENLTGFNITVVNDQNKVVYQSEDPNFIWDGLDQGGNPIAEGRYVYVITAKEFSSDKPRRYSPLYIKR